MSKTLIFGHRNPDTDSICSALAYADLKTRTGADVEAVRLGSVSAETQFVLDAFNTAPPRLVESVAAEASHVILVDHNERQQSAIDIDDVTIAEVIDHHRIANFETAGPLYYRAEPVGCTSTIVFKMFKESGVAVSPQIGGLMLSAIVSDTLLLKSPTCTPEDVAAAQELAPIAGVDLQTYGLQLLKAGASLRERSIAQLISTDSKEFPMGRAKVEIAQVTAVDVDEVLCRQDELEAAMRDTIAAKGLDLFLFVITDILNNDSIAVALGPRAAAVEAAFGVTLENNRALLIGVVSRKLQIVPVLTDTFSKS
ncbi:MAG: manganese-dependent inorganic pyrophosphatase [Mycobacterium sp.]|jgi:manganese-dependent inorganic pyrophosphatase|nr:manganese-dependent inorganic pyrophosphatase [Mycobacterium sp.]